MSPSSSGSWSGGRGANIIDLDRYMRGNVRPSRPLTEDTKQYEQLVVDAGAATAERKPRSSASGDARFKRYSHDSGVSDTSYRQLPRKTHRPHRRSSCQDGPKFRPAHDQTSARTLSARANSSSSLRAFRAVCEQALLDQQRQIARVAELCERLTERAEKSEKSDKNVQNERINQSERNEANECSVKVERVPSAETSEISSSSRSTKDQRRKDKHRTQECKTYKIIMNKLDELNRLFATRPRPAGARPRPPRTPSSTSVSVCDKLTATEPQRTVNRVLSPTVQVMRMRNTSSCQRSPPPSPPRSPHPPRASSARAVTRAFAVDIAPHANVLTESVVKCDSSSKSSQPSVGDPRCGFDLEDPVHLYSQAKKLQTLTATTRRTRSRSLEAAPSPPSPPSPPSLGSEARAPSLCAVCRGYWRVLRRCARGHAVDACKCS